MDTVEDAYQRIPDELLRGKSGRRAEVLIRGALVRSDLAGGFDPVIGMPSVDFDEVMQAIDSGTYYKRPGKVVATPPVESKDPGLKTYDM
jgi:hypothetical protein